jgi:nucleoside-diphosphate-sugar epimerase
MKILVTGAAGFIGFNVSKYFVGVVMKQSE